MDKRDFAFDKMNFIMLAIGMAVVVIGFLLMSGDGSTEHAFNPDIFSAPHQGRSAGLPGRICLYDLRRRPPT